MANLYVGEVGKKIKLDSKKDLSSATLVKIKYEKPDGSTGEWDAEVEETTYVVYVTETASDIDLKGTWSFRIYVEIGAFKGHGDLFYKKAKDPSKFLSQV